MWEKVQAVVSVLGLLCGFVLILALAYGATRLLGKRFGGFTQGGDGGVVQVLSRTVLGPDRQLLVVRAAGRTLLLGAAAQSISLLCELDASQLPDLSQPGAAEPFSEVFRSILGRKGQGAVEEARDE